MELENSLESEIFFISIFLIDLDKMISSIQKSKQKNRYLKNRFFFPIPTRLSSLQEHKSFVHRSQDSQVVRKLVMDYYIDVCKLSIVASRSQDS